MQSNDIDARLECALQVAGAAGDLTLEHFRKADLSVERKSDDSPVTVADRGAEELARKLIGEAFPDDAIVGEEFPSKDGASGWRWILDPIDGTKSFIHGVPLYGTMIGIDFNGESKIGVVRIPGTGECIHAAIGGGAWYRQGDAPPCPARVSECCDLSEALFLTSEVATFDKVGRRDVYESLQTATRLSRTWGDCFGYMLVATGRADVMVDPKMSIWDAAALLPILQEAGGTFTDWKGVPTIDGGEGVATNGALLKEVIQVTKGA